MTQKRKSPNTKKPNPPNPERQTNLTLINEVQMSRALRRHHTRRLKRNRKNYWHWNEKTPGELGVLVNTPQRCSCYSCGNQRKWEGETRQEQIARIREREGVTE